MNHRLHCTCKLAQLMRDVVPLPGTTYQKMILVDLEPGESVPMHAHAEHTVLYYPYSSLDPIVVWPQAGMMVYLPPGTEHEVEPVREQRKSIAMIVEPYGSD